MPWEWIPPTLVALLALFQAWRARGDVRKLHVEVNSRLTELLRTTRVEGEVEGHEAGVQDERRRRAREQGDD